MAPRILTPATRAAVAPATRSPATPPTASFPGKGVLELGTTSAVPGR
jgi:hypothetical protein